MLIIGCIIAEKGFYVLVDPRVSCMLTCKQVHHSVQIPVERQDQLKTCISREICLFMSRKNDMKPKHQPNTNIRNT